MSFVLPGSILVVYSRPSFVHLWLQGELYNQRDWMAVIVVTDEPLTSLETIGKSIITVSVRQLSRCKQTIYTVSCN